MYEIGDHATEENGTGVHETREHSNRGAQDRDETRAHETREHEDWSRAPAQQQRFRVQPANTSVIEGDSAVLRCEVDHQVGQLQWAKEGFAMGYSRQLPGFPRYRLLGDPAAGVHDLEITNVTLEDDGRFQCQVSPNRGQAAIRAVAFLTVLMRPTAVRIRASDWLTVRPKVVQVRQGQHVTLECDVTGAKPAAGVTWQKNGVDVTPEFRRESVRPSAADRRNDTSASVTLQPTSDDDGATFTCAARHPAVRGEDQIRYSDSLTLSVLYPPGAPVISGYADGDVVVRGDKVTLICTSEGGNPRPTVVWLKNGRPIGFTTENITGAVVARYAFTAEQSDLNAIYQCEAKSAVQPIPVVALVQMNVHFGPQSAVTWGTERAMEGEPVHVTCRTSSSNPPANITWTVNGRTMTEVTQIINLSPGGGWVTTSNLSTVVPPETRKDLEIACYAANRAVSVTEVGRHTVTVLYPPQPPEIPRAQLRPVRHGERLTAICAAPGGSPPAQLTWTLAGRAVTGRAAGPGRSRLELDVTAEHNGAVLTCSSSSPALSEPQHDAVTITVHFPPSELEVSITPEQLRAGQEAELSCVSRPSLPAAQLSWWIRGQQITDQIHSTDTVPAGENGGFSSRLVLRRPLNWTDHGALFICKAEVPEIAFFIRHEVTLNVLHPPVFTKQYYEDSMIVGESRVVRLPARANPAVGQYTWSRDRADGAAAPPPPTASNDGAMNLTSVRRADAGWYRLEATNALGAATARVRIDVLYPPEAVKATSALVSAGEDALLECSADARPAASDTIRWERPGFDLATRTGARADISGDRLTSYLAVYSVTPADVGEFNCVVDNGVGGPVTVAAALLVAQSPQVERSAALARSAAEPGQNAALVCRVRAAPAPGVSWSRAGRELETNRGGRYSTTLTQVDLMTWESVLRVSAVTDADFGDYSCAASNRLGGDSRPVRLVEPSVPEPPLELRVLNVSSQAVTLAWTPGFDGGFTQTFRLEYAPSARPEQRRHVEAPPGTERYTVDQLSDATEYRFSVSALNRLGRGEASEKTVTASTTALSAPVGYVTERDSSEGSGLRRPLILAATAVGTALLLINGLLILCYIRRRYRRKGISGPGSKADGAPHCGHESSSSLDVHGGDVTRDVCDVPNMDRDAWLEVVRISPPPEYGGSTLRLARQASSPDQAPPNYGEFPPAAALEPGAGCSSRSARSSATPDLLHRTADSSDSSCRLSAPARPHGSTPYLAGAPPAPPPPARAYRTLPHRTKLRIPSSLMNLGGSVPPPLACDLSYEHRGHLV